MQKILAAAGLASRRAAEVWIREGRVTVNGRRARLGDLADPVRDRVAVDGRPIRPESPSYWVVHKPRGVLTTVSDPRGRPTVVDLLPRKKQRLFPVGRLDRDTEGLVLLTNDGAAAHVLLHPSHESEREYRVTARGRVSSATLRRLERGVRIGARPRSGRAASRQARRARSEAQLSGGGPPQGRRAKAGPCRDRRTAPARVGRVRYARDADASTFSLTLIEGRKRQIRRAMSALGHPVTRLVRTRIGPLRLGTLARGRARALTVAERRALLRHVERRAASRKKPSPRA